MRLTWDAPSPRQNLPWLGWVGLFVTSGVVLGLASQGWLATSYAIGGIEAAVLLYYFMRGEIGPTAWAAWSVERLVEQVQVCTALIRATVSPGGAGSVTTDRGPLIAKAKAQAVIEQRTCTNREHRSASTLSRRLHGLIHPALLRARLTSTRATTTAIR
jgi:hypothetical protein